VSKKEIKALPEGFLKAFGDKASYAPKNVVSEETEIKVLEAKLSESNRKINAARIGGVGNVGKLSEEKARIQLALQEAYKKAAKKEAMDPVGKADADIDNDGDVDSSDEYLHKRRKAIGKAMKKEEVEVLDESKALLKDYEAMKAQGKKDHNIMDVLMSMPKYKKMSRDQMAKVIGDAKRKGIFKEDVDITELHMSLLEAHGIEKKVAERVKKVFDAMSDADKAAFMKAYLKNPKAATDHMFSSMKKMAEGVDTSDEKKSELEEATMSRVAKELEAYAQKNGGIDKMDFMKAAMMMKKGQTKQLKKFVDDLDTEPREKILHLMNKDADRRKEYKAAQKKMREEVELEENMVASLAKDFENRLKKAGNSDSNQNRERMATLAMAKKKGASAMDMKNLDKAMNAVMNKLDEEVELEEGPFKGIGKMMMKRKLKKKADSQYDDATRAKGDALRHHRSPKDIQKQKHDDMNAAGKTFAKTYKALKRLQREEVELDEGILKPYHAAAKQPWSKTVKDSKGTAGEYKQIGKGKDFTIWTAYRGSNKSQPHYVVRDDKVIGSGMAFNSALKDAKVKEKDVTHRSKFADGSILNKGMKEQVELEENYTINHKTFSAAVQHAKSQVEKKGYTIDDDEWDRKVAMGPRKPGTGKTNRYTIDLMKGGKETKRKLQMQVYYDEGRYELNMYVS
jgi:hypothetical protein